MEIAGNHPIKPRIKTILVFVLHQLVGTIGIIAAVGFLATAIGNMFRLLGQPTTGLSVSRVLTRNPYFPLQIALALVFGWLLNRHFRYRGMMWVWVIPTAFLGYLLVALPTAAAALASGSRWSHFFGRGCRIEDHCFDQLGATLPFYVSVAYSLGAFMAWWSWHRRATSM